jgi:hypothetical protein
VTPPRAPVTAANLHRDARLLKAYAMLTSTLLVLLTAAAFRPPRKPRFEDIDAERMRRLP